MSDQISKPVEGLIIRATEARDISGITELANLPAYRNGTLRPPFQSEAQTMARFERLRDSDFHVVAELNGIIVGDAFLGRFAGRRTHVATLGMGVHDDWHGRGIGTMLMNALLDAADNWLDIKRIELTVYCDNARAITLYEKSRFETEGRLRQYAFRDGEYADVFMMARLKD